jgi:predicted DNA-binding protein YlxM (UPF0122 family)
MQNKQTKFDSNIDAENLLNFCNTTQQVEILKSYTKNNGDIKKISNDLNISYNAVKKCLQRIRNNSIKPNNTEEIGVRSTSTLYDSDGNVINRWVKKDNISDNLKQLVEKFIEEYANKLPKFKEVSKSNKNVYEDKLAIYPIVDIHLGMLSLLEETETEWNLTVADTLIRECVSKLISRSPNCKECLICNLGDYFHVDNMFNRTPTNGNFLDVDGRYAKIMNVGIKLMRYLIEYASYNHKHITVINCIGNHDLCGSMWLSAALENIYENNKSITVINSSKPRQYFKYGNSLIGMTHGVDCLPKDLPLIMATEKIEDWGNTKFHYWYTGHIHQEKVTEFPGCKIESFKTIAGKDAWTNSKGFLSKRGMCCIIIDPKNGETERYNINI